MSKTNYGCLSQFHLPENATYNGIVLPESFPQASDPSCGYPQTAPWLLPPEMGGLAPEVVNVDRGRQLFVDDFLIEESNLTRAFYSAKLRAEPVLQAETVWEKRCGESPAGCGGGVQSCRIRPGTAATSGGVWYDMDEKIYKAWYEAGFNVHLAYAVSTDGIRWERPALNEDGSNLLVREQITDSYSIWIDYGADADERYKMLIRSPNLDQIYQHYREIADQPNLTKSAFPGELYTSADGIRWKNVGMTGIMDDRSTFFYDAFRRKWVFSIRGMQEVSWGDIRNKSRIRRYHADEDFRKAGTWKPGEVKFWLAPDASDRPKKDDIPQLYNFDSIAYESVMIGMMQMWYGPENEIIFQTKLPKHTELQVGFSRDGFHYDRPCREAFIPASRKEGTWDYGYLQSATGGIIVYDDELRIYYSGFSGRCEVDGTMIRDAHCGGAIGYATLRRDGFASMNGSGALLTKKLTATKPARYLFVNADTTNGALRAELLDGEGRVLEGYSAEDCEVISEDTKKKRISWKKTSVLPDLRQKAFRIRFLTENGKLYSFWLACDEKGRSDGECAAGYVGETF